MTSAKDVILVAVDGSDCSKRALDEAIQMAKALNTSLLLAHVVDWSDYSFINAIEIEERTKMRKAEEKKAHEHILDPMSAQVEAAGIEAAQDLRFGHPPRTLAKMAEEAGAKMIIAGTRGRSDVKSLVLGSFGHGLLQLAKRPVLLVP